MSIHPASGTPSLDEWHPFHLTSLAGFLPGLDPEAGLGHADDALAFLQAQTRELRTRLEAVPAEREQGRYAPGKWSLREVVGHLADTERILVTRLLWAARGDTTRLPAFDEEGFAAAAGHDGIPLEILTRDLLQVRAATLSLLGTLRSQDWPRRGDSAGNPVSARAWAFAIGVHAQKHLETIRTRYLA